MSGLVIGESKFNARIAELVEENEKLGNKLKRAKDAGEAKAGLVVTGATIVGVEGLLGYLRGRYGEKMILDMPAEVVGGASLELAAISGFVGKHAEIVANAGHATLGFVVALEAIKLGEEHRKQTERGTKSAAATETRSVVEGKGETVDPLRRVDELPSGERRVGVASVGRTMADDVAAVETPAKKTGT